MKKILIILAVFMSTASFAQRSFWSFNYDMSFATGEQQDYIGSSSFRGFGIDGRAFLTDNISVGGSWSWDVFDEIKRDLPPTRVIVDEANNIYSDISGVQYRYLNVMPLLVNGHYYMGSDGGIRPYFGVGIGTSYVDQRTDIGLVSIQGKKWGFAVQPEIGVIVPFGLSDVGANIAGKFRYTTSTSETDVISYFTLSIGIGFIN